MRIPPRRQLLLAGVVVVALVSTVFVAAATGQTHVQRPERWVGSWAMAPTAASPGLAKTGFNDQTVRMTVHTSVGGNAARIRVSNAYGMQPITIGHATVALPTKSGSGDVRPGTMHEVQFSGRATVLIPIGGNVLSDPIAMSVPASADLAISLWLPIATGPATWHVTARSTTWYGSGDHAADISGSSMGKKDASWYFVTGVDVQNRTSNGSIAVLGDSISDGFTATVDADHRWPDRLGERLNALPAKDHPDGVLDMGLSGSAIGHDGSVIGVPQLGDNATARLDRDVFAQAGIRTVILELAINDIWIFHDGPDTIINEMRQVALQAHERGIKIYVCTASPWQGFRAWTPTLDQTRTSVNDYIRSSSDFDGVIDFDKLLRDPENPTRLKPNWDSGDHIHPNDLGYQAMANYIPLNFLLS